MTELIFQTVQFTGNRPAFLPDSWTVFNGLRPLYGSLAEDGGGIRWIQHNGPNGSHWSAVNPADFHAPTFIEHNHRSQAVIVEYV